MNSENSTSQMNQVIPQKDPQNNDARKIVGTTGRLLNFLWLGSRVGKLRCYVGLKIVGSDRIGGTHS